MSEYKYVKEWRSRTVKRLKEAFGSKCGICSYNKCLRALEFHHLDPNKKDFSIGSWRIVSKWSRLVEEVEKCVLVCSNCHREVHDGITFIHNEIQKFDPKFKEYIEEKHTNYNSCETCGSIKSNLNRFCSIKCSSKFKIKGNWDLIDLSKLLKQKMTYSEIGRVVGVSGTSVKKRAKKMGLV